MDKICFVIMGYGKKTDPTLGKTFDLDVTYNNIIKPAVENAGFIIKEENVKDGWAAVKLIHKGK